MIIIAILVALLILLTNAVTWREIDYRSGVEIAGLPLIHVIIDFDGHATSHAKAVVALADNAIGLIAIGGYARGLVAFGAIAVGGVAIGAIAIGALSLGAVTLGLVAFGALAAGGLANGSVAIGFAGLGPVAIGRYAAGLVAIGQYRLTPWEQDRRAMLFFRRYPAVLVRKFLSSAITNREDVP